MTTSRPYSDPRSPRVAIAELRACAGTQFDPVVVEAFCAAWTERTSVGPSAALAR